MFIFCWLENEAILICIVAVQVQIAGLNPALLPLSKIFEFCEGGSLICRSTASLQKLVDICFFDRVLCARCVPESTSLGRLRNANGDILCRFSLGCAPFTGTPIAHPVRILRAADCQPLVQPSFLPRQSIICCESYHASTHDQPALRCIQIGQNVGFVMRSGVEQALANVLHVAELARLVPRTVLR